MASITGSTWKGRSLVYTVRPSPEMTLGEMRRRATALSSEELHIAVAERRFGGIRVTMTGRTVDRFYNATASPAPQAMMAGWGDLIARSVLTASNQVVDKGGLASTLATQLSNIALTIGGESYKR